MVKFIFGKFSTVYWIEGGVREFDLFKSEAHHFYFILDRVGQKEGETRDALIVYYVLTGLRP